MTRRSVHSPQPFAQGDLCREDCRGLHDMLWACSKSQPSVGSRKVAGLEALNCLSGLGTRGELRQSTIDVQLQNPFLF